MVRKHRPGLEGRASSWLLALVSGGLFVLGYGAAGAPASPQALGDTVVLAYNDLGMHCLNEDFSEICILPPYNTMRATVIDRTRTRRS